MYNPYEHHADHPEPSRRTLDSPSAFGVGVLIVLFVTLIVLPLVAALAWLWQFARPRSV